MSLHRKDNLGDLIHVVRNSSTFYSNHLRNVPANATSVLQLPIINLEEYWAASSRVLTMAVTTDTIMRSGNPIDSTKKVYLSKDELATATSASAGALAAQGTGLVPGDRVANIAHRKLFNLETNCLSRGFYTPMSSSSRINFSIVRLPAKL